MAVLSRITTVNIVARSYFVDSMDAICYLLSEWRTSLQKVTIWVKIRADNYGNTCLKIRQLYAALQSLHLLEELTLIIEFVNHIDKVGIDPLIVPSVKKFRFKCYQVDHIEIAAHQHRALPNLEDIQRF